MTKYQHEQFTGTCEIMTWLSVLTISRSQGTNTTATVPPHGGVYAAATLERRALAARQLTTSLLLVTFPAYRLLPARSQTNDRGQRRVNKQPIVPVSHTALVVRTARAMLAFYIQCAIVHTCAAPFILLPEILPLLQGCAVCGLPVIVQIAACMSLLLGGP